MDLYVSWKVYGWSKKVAANTTSPYTISKLKWKRNDAKVTKKCSRFGTSPLQKLASSVVFCHLFFWIRLVFWFFDRIFRTPFLHFLWLWVEYRQKILCPGMFWIEHRTKKTNGRELIEQKDKGLFKWIYFFEKADL